MTAMTSRMARFGMATTVVALFVMLASCGGGHTNVSSPTTVPVTTTTTAPTTDLVSENAACSNAQQLSADIKSNIGSWATYAPYIAKIEADLLNNEKVDGTLRDDVNQLHAGHSMMETAINSGGDTDGPNGIIVASLLGIDERCIELHLPTS